MKTVSCDVCVVGSGIAGVCAALEAARAGARVTLLSQGPVCSGASFSGTTWGLGMVGPLADEPSRRREFVEAVLAPAGGVGDPAFVRALADGFFTALGRFRAMGAVVSDVERGHEHDRAYVPCFDTDVRGWHGFHAAESATPLRDMLCKVGVATVEGAEVLSLLVTDGGPGRRVCGALAFVRAGGQDPEVLEVLCGAVVLATGGMAALERPTLSSPTSTGDAAVLTTDVGARVGNLAFEQVMVGIETPGLPAVFNEKLWRHTSLTQDGRDVFSLAGVSPADARRALEAHSVHGPYSRRLSSRLVEESVQAVGGRCLAVVERPEGATQPFVEAYMDWLSRTHGYGYGDPMPVALYHQASNGGIRTGADGSCGVAGLRAAGECAPVFAVDRLGGIASSTAMVFGQAAGRSAAAEAGGLPRPEPGRVLFLGADGTWQDASSLAPLDGDGAGREALALRGRLRGRARGLVAEARSALAR